MRTLLIALRCVTLSCVAGARTAIQLPCPAQQAFHDLTSAAALAGACCNDADITARTGNPCKAGLECQISPSSPPLPPALTLSPKPAAPLAAAMPTPTSGRTATQRHYAARRSSPKRLGVDPRLDAGEQKLDDSEDKRRRHPNLARQWQCSAMPFRLSMAQYFLDGQAF